MDDSDAFEAANVRGAEKLKGPRAVSAHYDKGRGKVVVGLSTGVDLSFSPHNVQGLERAKPDELAAIEISPTGLGLHFPALDADLYMPALLEGVLGSRHWMAARLGKSGGKTRTAKKAQAARANGRLGGRPKKKAAAARQ